MAINIEWQVKPPSKNEDKPLMFPRITDSKIVNEQQLAELMHPMARYPEEMPRLLSAIWQK